MILIFKWILNALILWLVAYLVPGIEFAGTWPLLITVLIFGFINALIRPIVILFTLPINFLTLGLFTLIINAFMFWLASTIVKGFEVSNFAAAFWGALIYWLIVTLLNLFEKNNSRPKIKRVK